MTERVERCVRRMRMTGTFRTNVYTERELRDAFHGLIEENGLTEDVAVKLIELIGPELARRVTYIIQRAG